MSRYLKNLVITDLSKRLEGVNDLLVVDVVGMNAEKTYLVRKQLREKGLSLMVVRRTLAAKACEGTSLAPAFDGMEGSAALVWGGEDFVDLAKEIVKLNEDDEFPGFTAKGGVMDGESLNPDSVKAISKWPNRAEQLSLLMGQILGPGRKLAAQLYGPGAKLASQVEVAGETSETRSVHSSEGATNLIGRQLSGQVAAQEADMVKPDEILPEVISNHMPEMHTDIPLSEPDGLSDVDLINELLQNLERVFYLDDETGVSVAGKELSKTWLQGLIQMAKLPAESGKPLLVDVRKLLSGESLNQDRKNILIEEFDRALSEQSGLPDHIALLAFDPISKADRSSMSANQVEMDPVVLTENDFLSAGVPNVVRVAFHFSSTFDDDFKTNANTLRVCLYAQNAKIFPEVWDMPFPQDQRVCRDFVVIPENTKNAYLAIMVFRNADLVLSEEAEFDVSESHR
ncbi:50S ribosomal protein L10 [bacterium]|nr:50S ribosomal protein L10 [bacterium]